MSTRSDAAQDFSRLTSEEFDGLWGQKARETLSTFQRILTDYERGIWQQGVNQILNQISSGATTIDNPLISGWISGLEYVESYFPTLYKHFNDLFGDNDTLDVSQVADYYGISSETLQQFGSDTSTEEDKEEVISEDVVSDLEADQQETIETVDETPVTTTDETVDEAPVTTTVETVDEAPVTTTVETVDETPVEPKEVTEEDAEEVVTLDADDDLMGEADVFEEVPDEQPSDILVNDEGQSTYVLNAEQREAFENGEDVVMSDGTVINNADQWVSNVSSATGQVFVKDKEVGKRYEGELYDPEGTLAEEDAKDESILLSGRQSLDFNSGRDVVLDDGTVINNRTHEQTGTGGFGSSIRVSPVEVVETAEEQAEEAAEAERQRRVNLSEDPNFRDWVELTLIEGGTQGGIDPNRDDFDSIVDIVLRGVASGDFSGLSDLDSDTRNQVSSALIGQVPYDPVENYGEQLTAIEDEDLLGTTDVFVQVEEGAEDGDPFFEPPIDYPETDDTVEVDDVGYEVTEPEVTFEDPTEEAGGGGGATDATEAADTGEAADATDEASEATDEASEATDEDADVTSTTEDAGDGGMLTTGGEVVKDRPFAVPNGPWIYIGEGRWILPDWDLIDRSSVIDHGDGTYSLPSDEYEDDSNWIRIEIDPTWTPDSSEVFDVGDTADIVGSGEPYHPDKEEETKEDVIDIFFPTDTGDATTDTGDATTDAGEVTTSTGDATTTVTTVGTGDGTGVSDAGTAEGGDAGTGAGDVGDTTTVGTGGGTEGTGDEGDGVEGIGTDGTGDGTGGVAPVSAGGMFSPKPFQGYMGGLSYQLPEFKGVYYQPRDYDVELNRIIQQSLFQGMY